MKQIFNHDTGKLQPLTDDHKQQIREYLTKTRMSDYGYTRRDWRRIQRQRQRAKSSLMASHLIVWQWDNLWNRWYIKGDKIFYAVGQSENEELTNQMRQLDPRVKNKDWQS